MDKMTVVITLSKEVPDQPAGRAIYDLVKENMKDHPDITINGSISNHFDRPDPT